MKDTAPISLGIIAVAGLFALIAAGVAYVLYDFEIAGAVIIGGIVGLIAAVALALGWREPAAGPQGVAAPAPQPALSPFADADSAPKRRSKRVATSVPGPKTASAPVAEATPAAKSKAKPTPDPAPAAEAAPAPEPTPKPAPAPKPAAADGTPEFLSAARDGGPDDLKQIKGVGPKLEKTLHEMGIYHFDQISTWGPKEQAWMDDNLAGFKGRATRDNWVEQAKTLAAGGTTEFSSKVKKGNVY